LDIRSYVEVTKPKLVSLLVFTTLGAMFISSKISGTALTPSLVLWGALSAVLGSSGANALTNYIDRDIDSIMHRTSQRPLPSKRIDPPVKALYFGLVLVIVSLAMASVRNLLSAICILLGVVDNVVVYSMVSKRKSPWNIILGSFSGGLAPMYGWTYASGTIDLTAALVSSLVVLWIPSHVWALAMYYKSDYERAKIPMLPVVASELKVIECIISTVALMLLASIYLYLNGTFGTLFLAISVSSGLLVLAGYVYLHRRPSLELAWKMFKFSSPHLVVLYSAMVLDLYLS